MSSFMRFSICASYCTLSITMQYTDTEAALIGGLISNYFFQPSVDATLCESLLMVGKEAETD